MPQEAEVAKNLNRRGQRKPVVFPPYTRRKSANATKSTECHSEAGKPASASLMGTICPEAIRLNARTEAYPEKTADIATNDIAPSDISTLELGCGQPRKNSLAVNSAQKMTNADCTTRGRELLLSQ